ncbi:hypothetical protein GW17_00012558 [Ensete ventricosum]|nr:hypothetical protein GW17_00012558 [Ensete ventricosum]
MVESGSGASLVEEHAGDAEGSRVVEGSGCHDSGSSGNAMGIGHLRKKRRSRLPWKKTSVLPSRGERSKSGRLLEEAREGEGVWQWVQADDGGFDRGGGSQWGRKVVKADVGETWAKWSIVASPLHWEKKPRPPRVSRSYIDDASMRRGCVLIGRRVATTDGVQTRRKEEGGCPKIVADDLRRAIRLQGFLEQIPIYRGRVLYAQPLFQQYIPSSIGRSANVHVLLSPFAMEENIGRSHQRRDWKIPSVRGNKGSDCYGGHQCCRMKKEEEALTLKDLGVLSYFLGLAP